MNIKIFTFILFSCLLFLSCEEEANHSTNYYHWKSSFAPSQEEWQHLAALESNKIYLRLFDIKWVPSEKAAFPFAQLDWEATTSNLPQNLELIPTVYITNRSIEYTLHSQIDSLATRIAKKIERMTEDIKNKHSSVSFPEIQIDCDWSLETKDKYFQLLEVLKDYFSEKQLSATIRLHQIKYYEKTGIPPVDRGILMFYNMGEVTKYEEHNSILDMDIAKRYFVNFDNYPLQLDIALPLFRWGVQFRDKQLVQLVNGLHQDSLIANKSIEQMDENHFKLLESQYLYGSYMYKNDIIRTEAITSEQLSTAMTALQEQLGRKDFEVIFYHLDEAIIQQYPSSLIQSILK